MHGCIITKEKGKGTGLGLAIVPKSSLIQAAPPATIVHRAITPHRAIGFCIVRRRQAMSRNRETYFAFLKDALTDTA